MSTQPPVPLGSTALPEDAKPPKRTLDELIVEQGVAQTATFDHLLGSGAELWKDDADFDAFLAHVEAIRRQRD